MSRASRQIFLSLGVKVSGTWVSIDRHAWRACISFDGEDPRVNLAGRYDIEKEVQVESKLKPLEIRWQVGSEGRCGAKGDR